MAAGNEFFGYLLDVDHLLKRRGDLVIAGDEWLEFKFYRMVAE